VFDDACIGLVQPCVTGHTTNPRDFWPGRTTVLAVNAWPPAWG
jgi:hypothetical protein